MKNECNMHEINLSECFSNPNGKTSSNKLVGVTTSFVCLALFITLVIYYFINPEESATVLALIDKTTIYFGIAAGIMGVKTFSSALGGNKITISNSKQESETEE